MSYALDCTAQQPGNCSFASNRCVRIVQVLVLLIGFLSLDPLGSLHAQTPDSLAQDGQEQMYRVETTDGQVIIGTLVKDTETEVVLDTREIGKVTIERQNVRSMTEADPSRLQDGQYWFPNPQSTRHFFSPNAIGIPKGQGYYQNTWVLLNNANYGVSEHFSVGAGTVPLFLFGVDVFPIWILPKVSVSTPQDNLHLAGGAVLGGLLGTESGGSVGLVYGASTVGNRDNNATLGIGYGYADGDFSDVPVINVSGMTRLGRKTYLLTENYFFAGDVNVVSLGIRYAPESFAVDFGLFRPLTGDDLDDFIGLPWLGVTIPFGR